MGREEGLEGMAGKGFEGREERADDDDGVVIVAAVVVGVGLAAVAEVVVVGGSDRFDTVKFSRVFAIAKTSSPCPCTCKSLPSTVSVVFNLSSCSLTPSTSTPRPSTSIPPTFSSLLSPLLSTISPLGTVGSSFPVVATSISLCKNHPVVPPSASTSHSLIPADIDEECLNRVHRGPAQDRISIDFFSVDRFVTLFAVAGVMGARIAGVRTSFAGEV